MNETPPVVTCVREAREFLVARRIFIGRHVPVERRAVRVWGFALDLPERLGDELVLARNPLQALEVPAPSSPRATDRALGCPSSGLRWPVLRCPPVAGLGASPRLSRPSQYCRVTAYGDRGFPSRPSVKLEIRGTRRSSSVSSLDKRTCFTYTPLIHSSVGPSHAEFTYDGRTDTFT